MSMTESLYTMLTVGVYTHSIEEKSLYVIGARMPQLCHESAKQKELTRELVTRKLVLYKF